MPAIHLVERLNNVSRIDRDRNEWESGYWVVSEETAQRLVGATSSFTRASLSHRTSAAPYWATVFRRVVTWTAASSSDSRQA
jgi:hypothetical protein